MRLWMLYQLPECVMYGIVLMKHGGPNISVRGDKTLLPSQLDHGGRKSIAGKRKLRHHRNQFLWPLLLLTKGRCPLSDSEEHPALLGQLGEKPFLMATVSQMNKITSHVTSCDCNCRSLCLVAADPLSSLL